MEIIVKKYFEMQLKNDDERCSSFVSKSSLIIIKQM